MKAKASDWYKTIWTLDIKQQSWVEDTAAQVDFLLRHLQLPRGARILDLACGFGRHALLLARQGFSVVGADITADYIADAQKSAAEMQLPNAQFVCSDIRDLRFQAEFDLVLNLADGAIGYLENDAENLKLFDVISAALKPGGRHVMDIINGDYADRHFPMRNWEVGEKALALSEFDWDKERRIMLFGGADIPYGVPAVMPVIGEGDPTRLYTQAEIQEIWRTRRMRLDAAFAGFTDAPANPDAMQMVVFSTKL